MLSPFPRPFAYPMLLNGTTKYQTEDSGKPTARGPGSWKGPRPFFLPYSPKCLEKINSEKFISTILNSPGTMELVEGIFSGPWLIANHKMWSSE